MHVKLRKPALAPPPVIVAAPLERDPAAQVEAYFRRVLVERMAGLPFLNPALHVAATSFMRLEGDWLGAVVTPWCLQLMLLPGGGTLWADIPAGERRAVALPVGAIEFIADAGEAGLPAFHYCPLIAPVGDIADMAAACQAAHDALATVIALPVEMAVGLEPTSKQPNLSRRAFLAGTRRTK